MTPIPAPGALALIAALLAAGPSPAAERVDVSPAQIEALGITLASPEPTEVAAGPAYPARAALPPGQERVVTAGRGGVVESVLIAEGQQVEADEPLARVQSAGIADLEREYLQVREQAGLARRQLERDEALFREGIIAERRLQESRVAHAQARAAEMSASQALEAAGLDAGGVEALRRSGRVSGTQVLVAPFAGTVLEVLVRAGERVDPTAPLLRLARTAPLWLEIRVPVEAVGDITAGDGVRAEAEHTLAQGRVILVGQRVDPADQSVVVRALVEHAAGTVRPGQLLQARLLRPGGAETFRVPGPAVTRRGTTDYVFVHEPGGFRPEPVRVLASDDTFSVVSGALHPADRIAVTGLAAIKGAWLGIGGE